MKSANVFLTKGGIVRLGDLNVSKVAQKEGLLYTQTGTPYYASPEVWKDQPYNNKSDIWSLGCVIYEACTLQPPFKARDMNGLFKSVCKGSYPDIPQEYSKDLRQILKALLQVQPDLRPSCEQLLEMQVIRERMHLLPEEVKNFQASL
jgi:NIMA (never in mitosis gene a)-related kinase